MAAQKKLNGRDVRSLVATYKRGDTIKEIAEAYGLKSYATVYSYLRGAGLEPNRRATQTEEV